jgi:hypothetical protein
LTETVRPHTLEDLLASEEMLTPERALALVRGAAVAVDALHARRGVHGSIAPSAFQVGGTDGVTLRLPERRPGGRDGRAPSGVDPDCGYDDRRYWSPQRRAGEPIRQADDLYALGLIAEALLRRVESWHEEGGLPLAVEVVLQAQLSWAPSARFASGSELTRELERAVAPPPSADEGSDESGPVGEQTWLQRDEPPWMAARRVAQARAAHQLALAEIPDSGVREHVQPLEIVHHPIQHRDYPDLPLPGGWVAVVVVVLCSVYLFPLYYILFPHG